MLVYDNAVPRWTYKVVSFSVSPRVEVEVDVYGFSRLMLLQDGLHLMSSYIWDHVSIR
jgi:hypothetical protein